jgi:Gly-Xaa carboxypeptidase
MEKSLPTQEQPSRPAPASKRRIVAGILLPLAILSYYFAPSTLPPLASVSGSHGLQTSQCAQPAPLVPAGSDELDEAFKYISSEAFRNGTIARLSGAVRVPTQSFDDLGEIGKDERWDVMYNFADYLKATFPRVHKDLKVEKVNTHGLLFTWQGSDEKLKPTLLMAHQDVVPVPDATVDAWTHPPFDGVYDGTYIWGRGSSDCKNQLIAILETVELLLNAGFKPKRSVVLPFGFDEEISGREGAGHLAPFLHERYGDNGIAAIVDEGATFEEAWGRVFAKPGVGEKGYTDVHIVVRMPGGHSSVPSDHTSIGVASELIQAIESEQYKTFLASNNPYLGQLYCGAEHAPAFPKKLQKLLASRASQTCAAKKHHDRLAIEAAKQGPWVKYLMQTSQAVDVIGGGVKVNALPERTEIVVNHRINVGEEPKLVWDRITALAYETTKKYNLTLHAFDGVKEAPLSISLSPSATTLDVAPITPTTVDKVSPYAILAGTVRAVYGEEIIVAPGIMTGNTDTRYYWDLTKHIFRFGPGFDPDHDNGLGNIHTVDERVSVANHINAVKWFTLFVRNMDAAELEV